MADPAEAPVLLNCRGLRTTRHGVRTLVEHSVAKAVKVAPSFAGKRVSPHNGMRSVMETQIRI